MLFVSREDRAKNRLARRSEGEDSSDVLSSWLTRMTEPDRTEERAGV